MPKMERGTWLLVILGVVALVFVRVTGFGPMPIDDSAHVFRNELLQAPGGGGLLALWSGPYFGLYVPVTYSVWWAWTRLLGAVDPASLHLLNVLVHIVNVALLWRLLRRVVDVPPWCAALAVAWFALHPQQVEVVAWIASLRDALALMFGLLALNAGRRVGWVAAALFVATLCKPAAVGFVFACIWTADVADASRGARVVRAAVLIAVTLPAVVISMVVQSEEALRFVPVGVGSRALVAIDAVWFYMRQGFGSGPFLLDYGRSPDVALAANDAMWVWLPLTVLVVGVVIAARFHRAVALGALLWIGSLVPVLGLVPFAHQAISTVCDRYAYGAHAGLALLWSVPFALLSKRRQVRLALGAVLLGIVVGALVPATLRRLELWRDPRVLLTATVEATPRSGLALAALGDLERDASRWDAAALYYLRALSITHLAEHYNNAGAAQFFAGRPDDALATLRQGLLQHPGNEMLQKAVGAMEAAP